MEQQYGTTLSNRVYLDRGSGNFNPPPNYPQTTNRGNAFQKAFSQYDPPQQPDYGDKYKVSQGYHVGVNGLYKETEAWTRPNPENQADQYTEWALKSTKETPSVLLNFFFSKENVEYLLEKIPQEIQRIRGLKISPQSKDELLVIMRNYYQRAQSGWLPRNTKNPNEVYPRGDIGCQEGSDQNFGGSLGQRLQRLNQATLEECVKQVLSGVDMYMTYYKDASSLPLPLERPTLTTQKGSRVLSQNVGFDSGHEFTRSIQSYNERYNII